MIPRIMEDLRGQALIMEAHDTEGRSMEIKIKIQIGNHNLLHRVSTIRDGMDLPETGEAKNIYFYFFYRHIGLLPKRAFCTAVYPTFV